MTAAEIVAILPQLVLAGTVVLLLLVIAVGRSHVATVGVTLAGLAAAALSVPVAAGWAPRQVTPLLVVDRFSLFYVELIVVATIAVVFMAWAYLKEREERVEEFYVLLVIAAFGSTVLVSSRNFASLFLGLETTAVALYGLIAYWRRDAHSLEAGLKYLVLAGATSAFLLFGIALVYADTGTLDLLATAAAVARGPHTTWIVVGVVLIMVGIGFELALVPFHWWTPDVYQGAPAPVGAFVATVSKGTVIALVLRYFSDLGILGVPSAQVVIVILAVASMLGGNLLALLQTNVKRILAYSSIAHVGYMFVGILAAGPEAVQSVTFYLVTYFVTTLTAFAVLTVLSTKEGDLEEIEELRGLFWRRPLLAAVLATTLFSLAGIPLTAGFFGKYYVVLAGVGARIWVPIWVLVAGSIVGLYYYLRIIVVMYEREADVTPAAPKPPLPALSVPSGFLLAALFVLLFWLGLYPSPFIRLVLPTAASLF